MANRLNQYFDEGLSDEESEDVNVLALVKGDERYVFLFTDSNRAEALRQLGRFARNSELSFTWYDAAVLCDRIREQQGN